VFRCKSALILRLRAFHCTPYRKFVQGTPKSEDIVI
jgi:hypothetical protein